MLKKTEFCKIVAVVDRLLDDRQLNQLKEHQIPILEFRLDLFSCGFPEALKFLQKIHKKNEFQIIGTYRNTGKNQRKKIMEYTRAFLPYVQFIDIEFEDTMRDLVLELAQKTEKQTILSTHNFREVPTLETMTKVKDFASQVSATFVKFAYLVQTVSDYRRFLKFIRSFENRNISHMAMGRYGKISRILAPLFYSRLNYGYIVQSNAGGQMSAIHLKKIYDLLYY